jgi:hypothetical protein
MQTRGELNPLMLFFYQVYISGVICCRQPRAYMIRPKKYLFVIHTRKIKIILLECLHLAMLNCMDKIYFATAHSKLMKIGAQVTFLRLNKIAKKNSCIIGINVVHFGLKIF